MTGPVIRRRLFAALALLVFAVGSALFWNDWRIDLGVLAINLFVASAGFLLLHLRWRRAERHALTPRRVKDIFS